MSQKYSMLPGGPLIEYEIGKVLVLNDLKNNSSEITEKVSRSKTAVWDVLIYAMTYNMQNPIGYKSENLLLHLRLRHYREYFFRQD